MRIGTTHGQIEIGSERESLAVQGLYVNGRLNGATSAEPTQRGLASGERMGGRRATKKERERKKEGEKEGEKIKMTG